MTEWLRSIDWDQWLGFGALMVLAVCVGLTKRHLDKEGGEE